MIHTSQVTKELGTLFTRHKGAWHTIHKTQRSLAHYSHDTKGLDTHFPGYKGAWQDTKDLDTLFTGQILNKGWQVLGQQLIDTE